MDDIQAGCGRTGPFFSFEPAGIQPDLVCLSKSISGCGLPMALLLIRPGLDVWRPGEHNGTFRGNNLAFVAGRAALDYWLDDQLERSVAALAEYAHGRLQELHQRYPALCAAPRGRGLLLGLPCHRPQVAAEVSRLSFQRGLVIETAGPEDEVLKLLPPLVIAREQLAAGLDILEQGFATVAASAEAPVLEPVAG